MSKERLYDMHSWECPDMCSLALSLDELRNDFEVPPDKIKEIENMGKNDSVDLHYHTVMVH